MRVYYNYSTITGQQHGITITGSKSNSKNKVLLHQQSWQKGVGCKSEPPHLP